MVYLLGFIGICVAFTLCWAWLKLVNWVFPSPKKKNTVVNPYIEAHKMKMMNDKMYEQYEDWMAKSGSGVPIPKIKSPEDIEAEKKISKLI